MIGRTLGNYRVIEQIGMGGMATVYKAYDPDTDRDVAIKVLPEHFSQDPTFRQRFEREAKAIAKLEHIHILPLFAYGEDGDTAYMVMRYLKAGSLTDRIRAGALPFIEASGLLNQIAGALDHAHAHGVLHRDVKPSNVLLDADGNAYLTDFGIAKMVESTLDLTGGGILGTPAYMSPEQCKGSVELTPASDQYSLGIILYEMVTGRAPFQAETPIALIHMQLNQPLPLPRQLRPDLPEAAERVILKSLAKDPDLRYESCTAMASAFARAVANAPTVVSSPMEDRTLAAEAPVALTSPAVEDATLLHDAAPVATQKRRGLPWWAWALIALLFIGVGVVALGIVFLGGDEEPTIATQRDVETDFGDQPVAPAPESVQAEFEDEVSGLPEDFREVKPCEWAGHGPGLCIYGLDSNQPVRKLLQDEGLESISLPSWSPDGNEIVFSAIPEGGSPDGDYTLYRVRADGTGLTKLPQLINDLYPDWSPDGEWLSFHSGCDLAIMQPDGSAPETIWPHDEDWCAEHMSWSPDSEAIVVSLAPMGGFQFPLERQIWFYSLGEDAYLIQPTTFEDKDCANFDVAFSPDGEQVAYFDDCQPMIVDASGDGQPRPISDFPGHWHGMAYPRWEGEMPELVEIDDQELPVEMGGRVVETCDGIEPPQICAREVETDRIFQITHDLDFESIYGLTWSPDGGQILFDAGQDNGPHDLYLIDADGSNLTNLTDSGSNEILPSWSPTGEWIAFHRDCSLWLAQPPDGDEFILYEGDEDFCALLTAWSPDGKRLAVLNFMEASNTPSEIWVMNADGSDEQFVFEVSTIVDPMMALTWDPSGEEIVFIFELKDGQTHTLIIDAHGDRDAQPLNEDDLEQMRIWRWFSNYWPQWGGL